MAQLPRRWCGGRAAPCAAQTSPLERSSRMSIFIETCGSLLISSRSPQTPSPSSSSEQSYYSDPKAMGDGARSSLHHLYALLTASTHIRDGYIGYYGQAAGPSGGARRRRPGALPP